MKTMNITWMSLCLTGILGFCGCQSAKIKDSTPVPAKTSAPEVATASNATGEVEELFDGKTLTGWAVTDFAGKGEVEVKNGEIILWEGVMTGVNYTNPVPTENYELELDACRKSGSDFFCGLTFPVQKSHCSLIVGGWGGGTVGISSIDGMDASENDTTSFMNFDNGKWYHLRIKVTLTKIQAWIDEKQVVNVDYRDKIIACRPGEIESSRPLGVATWATTGALKNFTLKILPKP